MGYMDDTDMEYIKTIDLEVLGNIPHLVNQLSLLFRHDPAFIEKDDAWFELAIWKIFMEYEKMGLIMHLHTWKCYLRWIKQDSIVDRYNQLRYHQALNAVLNQRSSLSPESLQVMHLHIDMRVEINNIYWLQADVDSNMMDILINRVPHARVVRDYGRIYL